MDRTHRSHVGNSDAHIDDHDMLTRTVAASAGALALGAVALAYGARRRPRSGVMFALAAGPLAYAAISGRWPSVPGFRSGGNTRDALRGDRGVHVRESVRIERPIAEVYHFWRRLENLPQFMTYLESVQDLDGHRSRWVAKGPAGTQVTWDAKIINDVENKVIGWQSMPGGAVSTAGSVNFDAVRSGRSTQVTVHLQYAPVAGRWGDAVARMFGKAPSQTIREDLRRLKQLLEARKIARAGFDEQTAHSSGGW